MHSVTYYIFGSVHLEELTISSKCLPDFPPKTSEYKQGNHKRLMSCHLHSPPDT